MKNGQRKNAQTAATVLSVNAKTSCIYNYTTTAIDRQVPDFEVLDGAACNIKCERTNTTSNDGYAFYRIYFFTIKSPKAQGGRENEARFF